MSADSEEHWERGRNAAYNTMLLTCIRALGGDVDTSVAKLVSERAEAIAALRSICEEYGDNDWPDDLNLSDIIEKHLHNHLAGP